MVLTYFAVCNTMNRLFLIALFVLAGRTLQAQPTPDADLLSALGNDPRQPPRAVTATFKATRLVTGHSVENLGAGVLDFRIAHRFNSLKNGFDDFFGLDGATTKIQFDYGLTNRITIGLGRSPLNKEWEGYTKIKLLPQLEAGMPVTVSYVGAIGVQSGNGYSFNRNLGYTNQILIARKFSERFSAQIMPTFAHYNLVNESTDPNNIFALGAGGRFKLSKRLSLNVEWYPVIGDRLAGTTNAIALGVDIETGGHVFQLHFTNSAGLTERSLIGQTMGRIDKGDIRFGFNISRVFTVRKPRGGE